MNELELIDWIRRKAGRAPVLVEGIGDDCAILRPKPGEDLLFTTDLLIEGVHFLRETHTARDCGHKALARGLSDIAAMGGEPRFCLVSLAAGEGTGDAWIRSFFEGLLALARKHRCALGGGDLGHADKTMADIIVCGAVPRGKALRRDGAQIGDTIWVSGTLGGSALGLVEQKGLAWRRHLRPQPRLALGLKLRELGATACMDLSDGLSIDLHRMMTASRAAAMLDGDLPVFRGAEIGQALHGGEDYELLFTLPEGVKPPRLAGGVALTRIGTVIEGRIGGIRLPDGLELQPLGYDHFRRQANAPSE